MSPLSTGTVQCGDEGDTSSTRAWYTRVAVPAAFVMVMVTTLPSASARPTQARSLTVDITAIGNQGDDARRAAISSGSFALDTGLVCVFLVCNPLQYNGFAPRAALADFERLRTRLPPSPRTGWCRAVRRRSAWKIRARR